jgi:membrane protease YdiL (CAAX protease family)
MIVIKELKNMVFRLTKIVEKLFKIKTYNKVTRDLFKIIAFIVIGIAIFEVSLQIKFVASNIKSIIFFFIAIIVVKILYRQFIKYSQKYKIIDNKYLKPTSISWKIKPLIITIGFYVDYSLEVILGNPNKSCNQRKIEEDEINFYTSIVQSGITAPIIEEIIFRGVLFVTILTASSFLFKRNKSKHDFLGISAYFVFASVFFGYVHVAKCTDIEFIGGYLASGIVLTLVFIVTRDIKLPIIIHMIINSTSTLNRYDYNYISNSIEIIMLVIFYIYLIRIIAIKKIRNNIKNYVEYLNYKSQKSNAERKIKKYNK